MSDHVYRTLFTDSYHIYHGLSCTNNQIGNRYRPILGLFNHIGNRYFDRSSYGLHIDNIIHTGHVIFASKDRNIVRYELMAAASEQQTLRYAHSTVNSYPSTCFNVEVQLALFPHRKVSYTYSVLLPPLTSSLVLTPETSAYMIRQGVQSMAFFHKHYLSFATSLCEKMVPTCARLQAIYATIVPRFAIQCISIWLTHNVHREYFANRNLRTYLQKFDTSILP